VQNWLKTQPKNLFFSDGINNTCETLEAVSWSRGGLRWKVTLISFLCIYNKYAFFKRACTFWLTVILLNSPNSFKFHNRLYYRKHNGIAQFYYEHVSQRHGEAKSITI
jgi:hypothetical protein